MQKTQVGPEGQLDSKLMIVGEAPGTTEVQTLRPFMGTSGTLLFQLLSQSGIQRKDCYITNVVKEQPSRNDISSFIKHRGMSTQTTDDYKRYEEILLSEVEQFTGNCIVAVGATSLYALTRKQHINKWRGSILQTNKGKKVIPIIHPAAALRQYTYTHLIRMDIRRILEEMEFPEVRLPARNLVIRPSFEDSISFLRQCKGYPRVAFDIEVLHEEVSCISFATSPYSCISIPFVTQGRDYFSPEKEGEIWREIASILEDSSIEKIGQNIVFDSTFLFRKFGIRTKNMQDTMIAQAIMYPDFPKGLDFICSVYTKEPYYKDEGKKWFKIGGNEDDFWVYNAKDSAVCFEAFIKLEEELKRFGNWDIYRHQLSLIEPLIYLQERGTKVEIEGLRRSSEEAGQKVEVLTKELHEVAGCVLNPSSPAQLKDFFYTQKGERPYINRKTGMPSVDKDALKRLSRKGHKEAAIIMNIRHLTKLKGTYLDVTLDKDNRLRCAFNPVGTSSGRLSSSETIFGTGTNLQNLPSEFKKFLMADNDCVLYNIDLSQAENRVVAYIAPEPSMIAAFERKVDIHRQTAGLIFSKPLEDISDEEGSSYIGGGNFSERFWGKKANHGLNYDLGYKSFAFLYEIPENESKFIVERYHTAYPGVRQYHAWIRHQLSKDRTLTNPFGRRRLFLDRWGDEMFKEAYSFIPQSTVADKLNRDGLAYCYYNQQWSYPIDLLNQVHDSLVFQINYKKYAWEQHAECLLRLRDNLESVIRWRGYEFSIPLDCKMGISLGKKDMVEVPIHEYSDTRGLAGFLSNVR